MVVERFESALWETSSLLFAAGDEAVLVDPAVSADEVDRIASRVRELGARATHVLATHADWDHVCGIAAFPDAAATMSEATAARLVTRSEGATTAERAAGSGVEIAGEPRVDRTFVAGAAVQLGPFLFETLALSGHTPDGTAFRCRALDVLAVGDHLSRIEFPFAMSTTAYRGTLAALIDLLRHDPPGRVVPGHGPELTAGEALEVAEADLAYLWALNDAVAGCSTPEEARTAGSAVEPPRAASDNDAEARAANVELALAERFA
ncbi:MAG TPA: MBL fold metallo-hydrolase [Gaiellaceae bacterium]|jgi:glyoxylase-like metal-dependent hydrolase (beta-lactamase superfamily II)|nr:MBL fold metallo-hydrolase [Gaiellaceae bacterium]